MRLLFCGDIVGQPGRAAVGRHLPRLRESLELDCVIANGENSAHGFGITGKICEELFDYGVDMITGGNHSFDNAEIFKHADSEERLLRPDNLNGAPPGKGHGVFETPTGARVLVINILCRLFMDNYNNPFESLERLAPQMSPADAGFDAVVVDVHGEASSEKAAIGHVLDGRATLVVGTHTHVPTADARILEGGTAFQTDAGMCGDYDSVIGMEKEAAVGRMLGALPKPRLGPAEGVGALCGVFVETDPATGLARRVEPVRVGGGLQESWPVVNREAAE